jgi:predicted O-methyltransferase YrrM
VGSYRALTEIPPLVQSALDLAERTGFTQSCIPEVGRLLAVLAAQVTRGTIAELGTGAGVGTAWIASVLRPDVSCVTVEIDAERASAARGLFTHLPNVEVVTGDWRLILDRAPFDLLFADGGKAKQHEPDTLIDALAPGGLLLIDDLTSEPHWPAEWRGQPDPIRDFWLNDSRVIATELLTTETTAVILVSRR